MMLDLELKKCLTSKEYVLFRGADTHKVLQLTRDLLPPCIEFVPRNKDLYDLCVGMKVPIAESGGVVLAEGDGESVLAMIKEYPAMWYVLDKGAGRRSREFMHSFDLVVDVMDDRIIGLAKMSEKSEEEL